MLSMQNSDEFSSNSEEVISVDKEWPGQSQESEEITTVVVEEDQPELKRIPSACSA